MFCKHIGQLIFLFLQSSSTGKVWREKELKPSKSTRELLQVATWAKTPVQGGVAASLSLSSWRASCSAVQEDACIKCASRRDSKAENSVIVDGVAARTILTQKYHPLTKYKYPINITCEGYLLVIHATTYWVEVRAHLSSKMSWLCPFVGDPMYTW